MGKAVLPKRLTRARLVEQKLQVSWSDATDSNYDFFWLRDNARDATSYNPQSYQRELFTAGVPLGIKPISIRLEQTGQQLVIQWPDVRGPVSYSAKFLDQYRAPSTEYVYESTCVWDGSSVGSPEAISFWNLDDKVWQRQLLNQLQTIGFGLIQDCPPNREAVGEVANLIGYVRETIFGGVWQFEDNQAMADSAYSSDELRPHTDGTYSHDAPGLQMLLCVGLDATGGESVLVDGLRIANRLRELDEALFADMTRLPLTGVYRGDGHLLRASRPVFRLDSAGRVIQVSFNNYDRDTVRMADHEMRRAYEGIVAIDQMLNEAGNQWRHVLKPGEMLIFDNWRVLHGRSAFDGYRRLTGAYVNREDFESKLRAFDLI